MVLALLLVNANHVVTLDQFIDEIWPDAPPASAVANVRGYVGQVRRLLTAAETDVDRLTRQGSGYLLRADPAEADLLEFAGHASAGREHQRRGNAKEAASRFGKALACWHGPMLAGLPRGPALAARCATTEDERLAMVEDLAAIHLELDEPAQTVDLLRGQVSIHPLRERGRLLFMRALYNLGDIPAALATYEEGRTALAERLGLEPGPGLQDLHRTILAGQPTRTRTKQTPAPAGPIPAQLPLDIHGFAGRTHALSELDAVLMATDEQPTAVVISAIAGTAGVGKTATAIHWAHRAKGAFPDGQLYVNLRGFDPSGAPVTSAEAVRGFLDALEIPPSRIPSDVDSQVRLYRSQVATRRLLIVLDNASDADQVRPLLPGSPGCLVLVTSRNQLSGLVAAEGAHPIFLDLLPRAEARALLAQRLGAERVEAESDAVEQIITRCARLPLALAIVAARAAVQDNLPLIALARELEETHVVLDALNVDDAATDIRAVFSWSCQAVSPNAARLFRLLGLHPGPDIGARAAATLAGVTLEQVRPLLTELTRAYLIAHDGLGRYAFHDLLRAYAADLASTAETDADRTAAISRLLDYYLDAVYFARELINPHQATLTAPPPRQGTAMENFVGLEQAKAWFAAERRSLIGAVELAADMGFDAHAWQLAWHARSYFLRLAHWRDWRDCLRIALNAARRLDDTAAQAWIHWNLSLPCGYLGHDEEAHAQLGLAEGLFEELGDYAGLAQIHRGRAWMAELDGDNMAGLAHAERSLECARLAKSEYSEARALGALGWYVAHLGRYEEALVHCRKSLAIQQKIRDPDGEGGSWDSLGYAYHNLGRYTDAIHCYRRSLELFRMLGGRTDEAVTLNQLGDTYLAVGDTEAARAAWQQALAIFEEEDFDRRHANQVRTKLVALAASPATSASAAP